MIKKKTDSIYMKYYLSLIEITTVDTFLNKNNNLLTCDIVICINQPLFTDLSNKKTFKNLQPNKFE